MQKKRDRFEKTKAYWQAPWYVVPVCSYCQEEHSTTEFDSIKQNTRARIIYCEAAPRGHFYIELQKKGVAWQNEGEDARATPEETTEDQKVFGLDAWVYCRQHVNAHQTGWCGVSVREKLGLGVFGSENGREAVEKCHEFGLNLVKRG